MLSKIQNTITVLLENMNQNIISSLLSQLEIVVEMEFKIKFLE